MSWAYAALAGYGVACIILFVVFLLGEMALVDWVHQGGWERLNKKIHWQRTRREDLMRDLKE
jgi:hypothetical protein